MQHASTVWACLTDNRCLDDVDDEVRDRAAMYLKVYEEPPLIQPYIKEGKLSVWQHELLI